MERSVNSDNDQHLIISALEILSHGIISHLEFNHRTVMELSRNSPWQLSEVSKQGNLTNWLFPNENPRLVTEPLQGVLRTVGQDARTLSII